MSSYDPIDIPLLDAIDLEILMHRDIHFGGNFSLMLEYYEKDGVGVMPDFSISKIKKLLKEEEKLSQNLSDILLPYQAKETVVEAKDVYFSLREVYETKPFKEIAIHLSDLILSEKDYPKKEIEALVKQGKVAVKPLIDLLLTDKFYDPLFPGYGRAPIFAAEILGKIQDEKAIPALFEALGQENFFTDEAIISALASFGKKSQDFLLKRLSAKPLSKDNEHAAMALTSMAENAEIGKECLNLLKDPELKAHETLSNYLILGCSGLEDKEDKDEFKKLAEGFSGILKHEMNLIAKSWNLLS